MDGFDKVSNVNPLGLFILLILGIIMIRAPRTKSLIPILVLSCFIPQGQRIVVAGMYFNFIRLMVVFGWVRILLRNEQQFFRMHAVDKLMLGWAIVKTIIYTMQQGSREALVYMLGSDFEALGVYFMARVLIRSLADIRNMVKALALISLPVLAFFVFDKTTSRNLFSVFGGVPEITVMREGRLRIQGAFSHPILAGSFWACIIPGILAILNANKRAQPLAVVSIFCILLIIFLCASSTPVVGVILAFIGMAAYGSRHKMRLVRITVVVGLLILSSFMKSPLWHLLARIDFAGGSTGYYRYMLIDKSLQYIKDWWLLGLASNNYWISGTGLPFLDDITNQYILEGLRGGALTLALFVAVIVLCFKCVGKVIHESRLSNDDERLVWSLGVTLACHCIMFLVVSYFGQITMLWNLQLAMVVSISVAYAPHGAALTESSAGSMQFPPNILANYQNSSSANRANRCS